MSHDNPTPQKVGPYKPTLLLHGGAGSITRSHLPPSLYAQYARSLASYASSTNDLLQSGATALAAACHAVCRLEDDPLFNCGRGAVFTSAGEIEMEASVMVSSVSADWRGEGSVKRGAGVSLVKGTRHPILLAREVLREGDAGQGVKLGEMHCQRSGPGVEEWGWKEKGLERKGEDWFWTKKRWEEHLRGLKGGKQDDGETRRLDCEHNVDGSNDDGYDGMDLPSQGTVGAVCMDSWGNLAVATSTGGLTNKKPGRIGDTPTLGAGFWAESWDEEIPKSSLPSTQHLGPLDLAAGDLSNALVTCLPGFLPTFGSGTTQSSPSNHEEANEKSTSNKSQQYTSPPHLSTRDPNSKPPLHRRAVAMSGTGNGDSFLRTNAVRTAAAICRFSQTSLSQAVTNIAGYDGELQKSAGERWGDTGEGEGGIIGIEAVNGKKEGSLVADFNCGGMWRAWIDETTGEARVMVFKEEYK